MTSETPTATPTPDQQTQATSAPKTPEQDTFQIIYTKYDDGTVMHREGVPSKDLSAVTEMALTLLRKPNVREVFLCTVHSAYGKEVNIRKVI